MRQIGRHRFFVEGAREQCPGLGEEAKPLRTDLGFTARCMLGDESILDFFGTSSVRQFGAARRGKGAEHLRLDHA
jgi:hypothetical protein